MWECTCGVTDQTANSVNGALPSPPTDISQRKSGSASQHLSPGHLVTTSPAEIVQVVGGPVVGSGENAVSGSDNPKFTLPGSAEKQWQAWASQARPVSATESSPLGGVSPGDAIAQATGDAGAGDGTTKERKAANKRGRYVPQACINCQKRKIKCSGEETCQQCLAGDEICMYQPSRKRRSNLLSKGDKPKSVAISRVSIGSHAPAQEAAPNNSLGDVLARLTAVERELNVFKNHIAVHDKCSQDDSPAQTPSEEDRNASDLTTPMNEVRLPGPGTIHGPTSIVQSITALNKIVDNGEGENQAHAPVEARPVSPAQSVGWERLPRARNKNIATLERETKALDRAELYRLVDVFFEYLNPHYPCLNECQFRQQLNRFLISELNENRDVDHIQFIALINLVCAEVKILDDSNSDSENVPGWDEFCRADTVLGNLTWLGNGNHMTVQCLIIKAKYLLYAERSEAAYDTIARAARLCFKMKYSNQDAWETCTPFEIAMRQRIMWTIFYFERNVALNSGIPYLIRESDIRVDLPKSYNDREMDPDKPLPPEDPVHSYGPCLAVAVKWGKLCAEIWDSMFSVSVQTPVNQELVASLDARILYTVSQLPPHLRWHEHAQRLHEMNDHQPSTIRQSIILYLRVNQLRFLLRQERMLSLEYDYQTAVECVSIAIGSINAIGQYINSDLHRRTDRFSSVLYVQGAILSLVCIIIKSGNPPQLRTDAIEQFKKGLQLLNQLRSDYPLARHALSSISRIIHETNLAISRHSDGDMATPDPPADFQMANINFDTLIDEFPSIRTPPRQPADESMMGAKFDGSFSYTLMNPLAHDLSYTTHELDELWLQGEFLSTQQMAFPMNQELGSWQTSS
ncbi:Fungal specific transcription factor domain-containing protein [Cladophialophora immunda]|nr:Fungal specific transcription factor domain-containing protein [Cladophialophora immunda]